MQLARAFALITAIAWLQAPGPGGNTAGSARLHHIHLRVADPAAALAKYRKANRCEDAILQGLGVGVRCGSVYLLFDRNDQPATGVVHGTVSVRGSGEKATVEAKVGVSDPAGVSRWLREHLAIDLAPAIQLIDAGARTPGPDEIAHIAIAVADPPSTTLVQAPGGLSIEIVRDTGLGPDTWWCPMHSDERAAVPGACPRCGMALVPIPPPVFGDYWLRVEPAWQDPTHGRLTLKLFDPKSGNPVTRLLTIHDRILHMFVVNRDLTFFDHVHPEPTGDDGYTIEVAWPGADVYTLFADFYPVGGTPQLLQSNIVTSNYRGSVFPEPAPVQPDARSPKIVDGLRISLDASAVVAGRESRLTFAIADNVTGTPVTDLEPYLGAPGHLFIVSADRIDGLHTHPANMTALGPNVTFDATLPRPGRYKLWAQFQRAGRLTTVPFVIEVPAR